MVAWEVWIGNQCRSVIPFDTLNLLPVMAVDNAGDGRNDELE